MSTRERRPASGLMGFVHRRRRGAELVLLLMSLVVGIGGYAAVGLGVDGETPVDLFTYGAWLAGLVIACHIAIRLFAEYADPILLPIVSALNGIGLAMIHRIDLADQADHAEREDLRRHPAGLDDDRGARCSSRVLVRAARPPPAAGVHLHRRARRDRAAAAAAGPRHRPAHQRRPHLDPRRPDELPAGRGRQGAAGDRLRRLPRACTATPSRWPADGSCSSTCPAAATSARSWRCGWSRLGILVFQHDLGSSLLFFGLFLVMLYIATERPGWLRGRRRHVRRRRLRRLPGRWATSQSRVDAWLHPFSPRRELLPDRAGPLRHGLGRPGRPRARARATRRSRRTPTPTSSCPRSARSSG